MIFFFSNQAREEAIARGEDPDLAEAMILNGGVAPEPVAAPAPAPASTGLETGAGLNLSAKVSKRVGEFICIIYFLCVFTSLFYQVRRVYR